jgi:hypothetical protein
MHFAGISEGSNYFYDISWLVYVKRALLCATFVVVFSPACVPYLSIFYTVNLPFSGMVMFAKLGLTKLSLGFAPYVISFLPSA